MHGHDQSADHDVAGVVAPPPLIFGGGLALGLLASLAKPARLLPPGLGIVRRPAGAALTVGGLAVGLWGVLTMFRHGTHPDPEHPVTALVTDGPFQYTRNPLYLSMTAMYLGITLLRNSRWNLLLLPALLAVVRRGAIEREEAYMERRFGAAYREYKARTPRWL